MLYGMLGHRLTGFGFDGMFAKERLESNFLSLTVQTFSKTVTAILASVKAREEGRPSAKPGMAPPGVSSTPSGRGAMGPPPSSSSASAASSSAHRASLPNYNRYDQEQFRGKDVDTHGFNIETMGTFSGMTLKSVTEGSQANRNKQGEAKSRRNIKKQL